MADTPLWLSHHWPGEYDRCAMVARRHICRRCHPPGRSQRHRCARRGQGLHPVPARPHRPGGVDDRGRVRRRLRRGRHRQQPPSNQPQRSVTLGLSTMRRRSLREPPSAHHFARLRATTRRCFGRVAGSVGQLVPASERHLRALPCSPAWASGRSRCRAGSSQACWGPAVERPVPSQHLRALVGRGPAVQIRCRGR